NTDISTFPYTTLFRSHEGTWPEDLRREPANGGEVRHKKSEHRVLPSSATSGRPVRRGVCERCNRSIRESSSRAVWQGYLVDGGRSEEHTSELQSRSDL